MQSGVFKRLAAGGIFLAAGAALAQTSSLPELGDSATQHLSPAQEKLIGQDFHRRLLNNTRFVDDHELRAYLQSLGDTVGAGADLRGIPLTFNLMVDNTLNAFAVPGGYITFNTGLLMATENESELASVVAHEIAHLSQRHMPRLVQRQNENRLPAIAAMIGAILAGGETGVAGATLTNATLASGQLAHLRSFEREADAIGIRLLAEAGFDPRATASFFNTLEDHTRHDGQNVPEFLRTHPLSNSRTADAQARAAEYPQTDHQDSFEYHLAKAKIRALYVERDEQAGRRLEQQVASAVKMESDAGRYGLAVYHTGEREVRTARKLLDALDAEYPGHPWITIARARNELAAGDTGRAVALLEQLLDNGPAPYFVYYYLVDAYLLNGQPEEAKRTARYQIRRRPDDFVMYSYLSRANARLGQLAEAHQADAEARAVLGDYPTAIHSLEQAAREADANGYLAQSIQARRKEFENRLELSQKVF